jgi:flavorubredoxin
MSVELYNDGGHICTVFRDLVIGEAVQANQFLIYDHEHAALIDPGGEVTYTRLFMAISEYMDVKTLDYVVASHQDPDAVASVNKWLVGTDCRVVVPALWERFIPHYTRPGKLKGRLLTIPDTGTNLELGSFRLVALPAHFLHAEGNFSFYDPISKILFSGDIGANFPPGDLDTPVETLKDIMLYMEGFHRRYMNSRKVCRYWANMIRELDVEAIIPQHGRGFIGAEIVDEFLGWIENLDCGVDLMTQEHYKIPLD